MPYLINNQKPLQRFVLCFLLFLSSHITNAQEESDFGSWLVVSGKNKINKNLSIPTVAILRHHEQFTEYEFFFFRSGLTLKASEKLDLTLGSAFLDSKMLETHYNKKPSQQFWVYGETKLRSKWNKIIVSNRLRWETRWIYQDEGNSTNHRLRYRFQFLHPTVGKSYIKVFNEAFYNIDNPHFNQNRLYVGVGLPVSKELKFEVGYLKLHLSPNNFNRLRMALLFKTDFTKKDRGTLTTSL